jgi:hypothetical protein
MDHSTIFGRIEAHAMELESGSVHTCGSATDSGGVGETYIRVNAATLGYTLRMPVALRRRILSVPAQHHSQSGGDNHRVGWRAAAAP